MTEVDSRESAGSPDESVRSRLVRRLPRFKQHKDLVVLTIGIVLSGVLTVIGVAHVNWPWLLGLGCGITAVAALATRALEMRKLNLNPPFEFGSGPARQTGKCPLNWDNGSI